MANVLDNLRHVWQQASLTHRMMLIGIVVGLLAVVGMLVHWSTKPDLVLLYGGLSQGDAAQISQKLRDEEIPHKVKDGGTTILAPAQRIHELRLTMVAHGLPAGGSDGYKILDRDGLGISPFKEKVNFVRAISGELEKTLMLIHGVINARVMLVSPDQRLMSRGKQEASASVYLKTRGSGKLSRGNILAVTNLVAGAVKGVRPEKVVVVVNGQLEAGQEKDELAAISGSLFERKMQIEQYLSSKAEDMLARVLGPGRATVKVDATLTTKTVQRTKRTFDLANRTEKKVNTTSKSGFTSGKGRGKSSPTTTKNKTETIEYDTPYSTEQTAEGPGVLKSIAVAVFVDLSEPIDAQGNGKEGEAGAKKKMPTVKQIETAVRNALGLTDSGELTTSITVVDVPFQRVASGQGELTEEAGIFSTDFILEMVRRGSLGVVVLGMLLALKIFKGKKAMAGDAETAPGEGAGATAGASALPSPAQPQFKGADKALKMKISTALTNNPDQVKQLFLSWIESSQGK